MSEPLKRGPKINGWRLVGVAFATGLLLIIVFFVRSHQTASSDAQLCRKIDRLDVLFYGSISKSKPPTPGTYGYAYWRAHHKTEPVGAPGGKPSPELLALLRAAACDPNNLPTKGGKP